VFQQLLNQRPCHCIPASAQQKNTAAQPAGDYVSMHHKVKGAARLSSREAVKEGLGGQRMG
jgi:hypothetical protein